MDNNRIFEKVKMKIAISSVKEEDIVMEKKQSNILKNVGIAACILFSMSGIVFATNMIINKFGPNSSDGSQIAIDNGYIARLAKGHDCESYCRQHFCHSIGFVLVDSAAQSKN